MSQLRDFHKEVLARHGALVEEIEPDGLEVVAPAPLQQALAIPEWTRLGFGPELPDGARRVTLDSEHLDRLGRLLGERGRAVRRVLQPENPSPHHPERALEHALVLNNAVYRLQGVAPAWTRYVIHRFRYTAISDEKRDGLLDFGINLANGATLDAMLENLLAASEVETPRAGIPSGVVLPDPPWTREILSALLPRALPPRLRRHLGAFVAGMARRQERDLHRVYTYHQDLQREAAARLAALEARKEATDKQQREQARLEAIAREYQAKVNDVRRKYAMKMEMEWLQTLEIAMPVQRFTVSIRRRKRERTLTLDWNPLARQLDLAPCAFSGTWEAPREVCDDALHLVSPEYNGPCPACEKSFCRACHPTRCPRCGKPPEP